MRKKAEDPKVPRVVNTYETEIEYDCPVRGKVKQRVSVKRLESVEAKTADEIVHSNTIADELDRKYSGLLVPDDSIDEENSGEGEV